MVMSCFLVRLEKDGKIAEKCRHFGGFTYFLGGQPKHMWGKTVMMEANPYAVLHSFTTHISIKIV